MLSRRRERGSGTLSAALGVTVFLAFLLLATHVLVNLWVCLLYTSPSPRDRTRSRMPSSA